MARASHRDEAPVTGLLRRAWATDRLHTLAQDTLNLRDILLDEPGEHSDTLIAWLERTADKFAEAAAVVQRKQEGDFVP